MAALAVVLRLVKAGQHVVAGDDIYGGTSRLLAQVAPGLGIGVTNVDTTDIQCASIKTSVCTHWHPRRYFWEAIMQERRQWPLLIQRSMFVGLDDEVTQG